MGKGAFGEVWTVRINNRPPLFVQKIYAGVESQSDYECVEAEVYILTLGCKYFPELIYSGHTYWMSWCIILEYIEGGTLGNYAEHDELKCNLPAQKTIAYQIADALKFLHLRNHTHGFV